MPNVNDLKSSRFLTKHDVTPDVLVTISGYEEQDVSMESQAEEMKWCLSFKELDKPLVLNMTNGQLVSHVTGSDEFDDWIGKQIVLYNDETIMFGGKMVGGIRVRAVKQTFKEAANDAPKQTLDQAVSDAKVHRDKRQAQINNEQGAGIPDEDIPF